MAGTNPAVSNHYGNVYKSLISGTTNIIEDTADAWDEQVVINATNSITTSDGPTAADPGAPAKGVTIAQTITASVAAGIVICSEAIAATDLSGQDSLLIRFKTTTAIPAGSLLLELDETALLASPLESIALPAIAGDNVGKWISLNVKLANPSLDTAIISIGWKFAAGVTIDTTLQYYQVIQCQEIQGMNNFSAPISTSTLTTSDYQSGFHDEMEYNTTSWTMDFGGHKEGAPAIKPNANYWVIAQEAETAGQEFIGQGFRTSLAPTAARDAIVEYAFSIQGTGYVQEPIA